MALRTQRSSSYSLSADVPSTLSRGSILPERRSMSREGEQPQEFAAPGRQIPYAAPWVARWGRPLPGDLTRSTEMLKWVSVSHAWASSLGQLRALSPMPVPISQYEASSFLESLFLKPYPAAQLRAAPASLYDEAQTLVRGETTG